MKNTSFIAASLSLGFALVNSLSGATSIWRAESGVLPTAATPPWEFYSEPTSTVDLSPDFLRLETSPSFSRATYFQEYNALSIPADFVIEARVRYVSGSSTTPARAAAGISFFTEKGIANWLWIGDDEIFVNSGARFQKGASAAVDTNDAFHDYRIEFHGTSIGSTFDVFYDGAFKLSGTLFMDDEDQQPELGWGDLAYEASGISEWQSFSHNGAIPEPRCSGLIAAAGTLLLSFGPRFRRA